MFDLKETKKKGEIEKKNYERSNFFPSKIFFFVIFIYEIFKITENVKTLRKCPQLNNFYLFLFSIFRTHSIYYLLYFFLSIKYTLFPPKKHPYLLFNRRERKKILIKNGEKVEGFFIKKIVFRN